MDSEQPKNPLHGVTLQTIVEALVDHHGFEELSRRIPIRCFEHDPSVQSSLKFLRKTEWARAKVEALYLADMRKLQQNQARNQARAARRAYAAAADSPGAAPRIVRLAEEEGPRLRAVRLRALQEAPAAFCSTHEINIQRSDESWTEELLRVSAFVAVAEGADVGLVCGELSDTDEDSAQLLGLWVAPQVRGKGVGQALVAQVAAWARGLDCRQLSLSVAAENDHAIALYRRCGFETATPPGAAPPQLAALVPFRLAL